MDEEKSLKPEDVISEKSKDEEDLNDKIQRLQTELDEWKDKYIRLLAEFDNYRKRQEKFQKESFESFADVLLCGVLEVVDDFERALALPSSDESFRSGVELIYKKMKDFLASYGVEEFQCKGEKFDPLMHEALSVCEVDRDDGDNVIVDVLQKGYKRGCRLIRAPKVVVGVKKKAQNEQGDKR